MEQHALQIRVSRPADRLSILGRIGGDPLRPASVRAGDPVRVEPVHD